MNPKGGPPVNDAEMAFARGLVRMRKLAHKTALRRRLILINLRRLGAGLFIGRFILAPGSV